MQHSATPLEVSAEEFQQAVELIRSGGIKRPSRPKPRLSTAAEVLKAAELRVITRTEARALLGLRKRQARS